MNAVVYTSNTGSTACYAAMLGKRLGLPALSLDEAAKSVPEGAEVLYLGWIMAGEIKGYKTAAKRYKIRAACGVGMGRTGSQQDEVREKNDIPDGTAVFTLQGGFDIDKLHGAYKLMMRMMVKTAGKALAEKTDRTPDEDDMLDMMQHGGDRVSEDNLRAVYDFLGAAE